MNREIKFRGKSIDNREWLYGYLMPSTKPQIHPNAKYSISVSTEILHSIDRYIYEVETESIGQFTGLKDINWRDIYEGDIVLQQCYNGKKRPMEVRYECGAFIVGYHGGSSTKRKPMLLSSRCEVIGNIHDNPELLKTK